MIAIEDKQQINAALKGISGAWAAGNGDAYAALFWEDARYVEAPGTRVTGSKTIGERHQKIFDTFFKGTRIDGNYPREFQEITPDVILVHSEGNVLFPGESDKDVAPNGLVTITLLKKDGIWKVAAFQNTPTGKFRGIKFMFRFFKSRFYVQMEKWRVIHHYMMKEKKQNMEKWRQQDGKVKSL